MARKKCIEDVYYVGGLRGDGGPEAIKFTLTLGESFLIVKFSGPKSYKCLESAGLVV